MEENSKIFLVENLERKRFSSNDISKNIKFKSFSLIKCKNRIINSISFDIFKERKNSQKNKLEKIRNPGVDFVRILAMYNIIFNHCLFHGNGFKHFPRYKRQLSLLKNFTDWHNDAFILLSGIVGYKTNKYSNLLYLWLTVFFYSVGIHKYISHFKKEYIINQDLYIEYYPIISRRYWFFTMYFGMYLFLPILNKGIESISKNEFGLAITSIHGIFIFWRNYKSSKVDIFFMHGGCSILWFFIFYLTGAYIGKYRVVYLGIKKYIFCLTCLFIFLFFSYLFFKSSQNELPLIIGSFKLDIPIELKQMLNSCNDCPIRVIQSITICLFFLQIHYNKYIVKVICFIGPLVFGVYLLHDNKLIRENVITHIFDNQPKNVKLISVFNLLLGKALKIFIFCIIIDYLRHLLFTLLRLKKIFILIEKKLKEKFK